MLPKKDSQVGFWSGYLVFALIQPSDPLPKFPVPSCATVRREICPTLEIAHDLWVPEGGGARWASSGVIDQLNGFAPNLRGGV